MWCGRFVFRGDPFARGVVCAPGGGVGFGLCNSGGWPSLVYLAEFGAGAESGALAGWEGAACLALLPCRLVRGGDRWLCRRAGELPWGVLVCCSNPLHVVCGGEFKPASTVSYEFA